MRTGFVLIFLLLFVSLKAEDVRSELESILTKGNELYKTSPQLSMGIRYELFDTHQSTIPKETHMGSYQRQGVKNFKMLIYGTLTIQNESVLMVKDDSSEVIMLSRPNPSNYFSIDKIKYSDLLKTCTLVSKITSTESGLAGFRMEFKNLSGEMEKVELFFEQTTCLVRRVVVYYNLPSMYDPKTGKDTKESPRLEVNYSEIDLTTPIPAEIFSVNKFVWKKENTWKINKDYAAYELLDQTNVQPK